MKKLRVRFAILTAILVVLLNCTAASALKKSDERLITQNSAYLAGAMELVMERYLGGDVSVDELYEGALTGMIDALDDYSYYMPTKDFEKFVDSFSGEILGIGVMIQSKDYDNHEIIQVLSETPAEAVGIKKGDIIRAVDGESVDGLNSDQVVAKITDNKSKEVEITVERGFDQLSFKITKAKIEVKTVTVENIENVLESGDIKPDNSIRYVSISRIDEKTAKELEEDINRMHSEGVTGIIIDFRGNPGGLLNIAADICNQLVPKGPIFYTIDNSGKKEEYVSKLDKKPFDKMVVLIDSGTASASELITSALQDAGAATVVGQTSYGKGVIQELIPIKTGGGIRLTVEEYLRRSGGKINKIGVKPDVEIDIPAYVDYPIEVNSENKGEDIPTVKTVLKYIGYTIDNMDQTYDDQTKQAVKEIQKAHGLTVDGTLSFETTIAIDKSLNTYLLNNDPALKKAYEIVTQR